MRKHGFKTRLLPAAGAALLLLLNHSIAADEAEQTPDTSDWTCKLCLVTNGWWGEWDLGAIYVDDPTPKFADYRGLIDEGWYLEASGFSRYLNEKGHYFDVYGRNLGIDSRALEMRGGKQGSYELFAEYSEIPRYLGNGTTTPYDGVGTDTLTLSDGWEEAVWAPAKLESERKTLAAGFKVRLGSAWKIDAIVERQSKDGTSANSAGLWVLNAVHFPAPLDYTTDLFRAGVEFAGNRGQVRFDFQGSEFENGYRSVTLDNPFSGGRGDELARNALAPDNEFHQFSLSAAYRLHDRFRMSGKASAGEMKQDVEFLPYAINPEFEDRALPRPSLNGKVDTSMFNLLGRVYIMLADRLDLTLRYKVNERDNRTPVDEFSPVMLEVSEQDPRTNRPYGYDRQQGKAVLRWRPRYDLRINAGLKRDTLERTYQDVLETQEDAWWGEVQFSSLAWLGARLKYEQMDRTAKPFEEQGNYDRAEHPLMRKFNLADRDRERVTLEFDLVPAEWFDVAFSIYTTDDEYRESVIGLRTSEEHSVNLDFNFVVNKHTNVYAFVTQDEIEAEMSGAASAGAMPWNAFTVDKILTWGLGITGQFKERFSYGFDYVSSDSDGEIQTTTGAGESPFPLLTTEFSNARAYLSYRVNARWGLTVDAYREEYDSSNWYIDGLGPEDISGVLTMGDISPKYDVHVVRLFATLKF
jgi:MtrB/PioB family decaheme-associated outer membrane protein